MLCYVYKAFLFVVISPFVVTSDLGGWKKTSMTKILLLFF